MRRLLLLLGFVSALGVAADLAAPARAQSPSPGASSAAASRGDELTIYLMTMGPGAAVWERFGHNAIWISNSLTGTDVAYNYGMFSFEQENFITRFIRGRMLYWMEGFDARLTAELYVQADRSVWAQELNLSPEQRADLRDYLETNALPENRFYRYDYFLDNCSTRVRDAIDWVLEGQIRRQTEGEPTGTTYREHTRRLTAPDPLLYTALMLALGEAVDEPISEWEEMFLPLRQRDLFRDLTIVDENGATVPLVRAEEVIYLSTESLAPEEASSRFLAYLFIGTILGLAIAATARYSRRRRDAAVVFRVLTFAWCGVAGSLGVILAGLWLFTDHAAAYRNENLFFFHPLLPVLALFLSRAVAHPGASRRAWSMALIVAAIAVAGVLLGFLPMSQQENAELIALALPVILGLTAAAWMLDRDTTGAFPIRPRPKKTRDPLPTPA